VAKAKKHWLDAEIQKVKKGQRALEEATKKRVARYQALAKKAKDQKRRDHYIKLAIQTAWMSMQTSHATTTAVLALMRQKFSETE